MSTHKSKARIPYKSGEKPSTQRADLPATMKAAVFVAPGKILLQERPVPAIGPTDALLRVTTTTICGTDVHILKGE